MWLFSLETMKFLWYLIQFFDFKAEDMAQTGWSYSSFYKPWWFVQMWACVLSWAYQNSFLFILFYFSFFLSLPSFLPSFLPLFLLSLTATNRGSNSSLLGCSNSSPWLRMYSKGLVLAKEKFSPLPPLPLHFQWGNLQTLVMPFLIRASFFT